MTARSFAALAALLVATVSSVALAESSAAAPAVANSSAPLEARSPRITQKPNLDTRETAYVLERGDSAVGVSFLGVTPQELYASVAFEHGLGKGVQLGVNLAHMGTGIINVSGKWRFLDRRELSLALSFAPAYGHGDWIWIAPAQALMAGVNLWIFPVEVAASSFVLDWLELDLAVGYTDIEAFGNLDSDALVLDAQLAQRQFFLRPRVVAHLFERSSVILGATVPLFTSIPASGDVTVTLPNGVVAGGTAGGRRTLPLGDTYLLSLGMRSMINEHFFVEIQANMGPRVDKIVGTFVAPRIAFEGRF